jgi:predicted enzyme related to lactoylglutathione lyase
VQQSPPYGAVIYAKDYQTLAGFYERVAGLVPRESDEEYVLLEAPSFQLVVLQVPAAIAERITLESPPRKRENSPIKLFLNVTSIDQARQSARDLGGDMNDAEKEWSFNGIKRCDGVDPEGNVFQVQEVA